jgi:biopolymer transport protein ExbB
MLQDILITAAAAATAVTPAASNAESLQQLGFSHMIQNQDFVSRAVLIFLVIMSVGAWWYTIVNLIKNTVIRSRADRVMRTFWDTPNAQDAIRFMEEQKPNEPFSKIALDCAQAAAHHQRHEGSRLVEALNRSEFIDRALRQAVTRESSNLENGLTWLATVGAKAAAPRSTPLPARSVKP